MAARLWGTIITLKSWVYADAGYVNYGELVRYATEEDAKSYLLKKIEIG